MASYYQRNGIYWLAIVINGKQKAFSLKTRDEIQAVKRGQKLEAEFETVSVSQLLTLWLKRKRKLADRTKADMTTTVEAFIEWFGNKPAGSLKKRQLYKYLDLLESKKYNNTSQSMFLRRLKILFNWGYKNDYISNQPFKGFDIPAWENRTEYLTAEEVKRVIQKAGELNPLHEQFLILLASTGARLGEISTLRWDAVNRKKRCITFKGKTGKRPFELTESIEACLEKIHGIQREHSDYIFSNKTGTWLGQYNYLSKLVKKYMLLAEVFKPFMGAHIFRHSFCSNKILQGESVFTIKELVGHRKIETTLNYIQVIPKMKKPANYWEN